LAAFFATIFFVIAFFGAPMALEPPFFDTQSFIEALPFGGAPGQMPGPALID
jgi:hypothetical protein